LPYTVAHNNRYTFNSVRTSAKDSTDDVFMLQEELRSLSSWMLEHSSDDIAIWRPNGGAHPLCPPPSLHHIDPTICDVPLCNDDMDCASGTGKVRPDIIEV